MPWLSCLAVGLARWKHWITSRAVHVGCVLKTVALRQVFLRVPRFSPVSIIPPVLHIHSTFSRWMGIGPIKGSNTMYYRNITLLHYIIKKRMPCPTAAESSQRQLYNSESSYTLSSILNSTSAFLQFLSARPV